MRPNEILIGKGDLTWSRYERISDRYGTVHLLNESGGFIELWQPPQGERGQIIARVLQPKASGHLGDWARGLSPKTPNYGDEFILGSGSFFSEDDDGFVRVGVRPDDGRESDWLDPEKLYNCHSSTVWLIWKPEEK